MNAAIALVIVTATLALVAWLLPRRLAVSRSAIVHGTPEEIRPLLAGFRARQAWIPWSESDPNATYEYGGSDGALGSTMRFEGKEVGKATLTLVRNDEREVVAEMNYVAPLPMATQDRFVLEPVGEGLTRVTWSNEGPLPFGPARLFAVFADRVIGPDYEKGLARLDAHLVGAR